VTVRTWRLAGAATAMTVSLVGTLSLVSGPASAAEPMWAPAETAQIHPGVQMYTEGAQCTANFVYTDDSGAVYVGYAAHCAGTGGSTATNGCEAGSLPLGTKVDFVEGGNIGGPGEVVGTGTLAYSSWLTMQQHHESDQNTCQFNDLALVQVDPAYLDTVNPSVPHWGGPVALNTDESEQGETVYTYGNSSLRGGIEELSPKQGMSLGADHGGWNHQVYTLTPGVPGDSGSAFLDSEGNALGTLSTVQLAPFAGSNGVGDLERELGYAQQHSGMPGLRLVPGTEPFTGGGAPVGLQQQSSDTSGQLLSSVGSLTG
jgi:hypothetical protein